jgi:hypothetical protein
MIILQFDRAYYHWGLLMVRSLALYEPQRFVFCDTVNLNANEVEALEGVHPRIEVSNDPAFGATSPELMAGRKAFIFDAVMRRFPDDAWYAMLDVDSLVRRPLDDLWALVNDRPAALLITDGYEYGIYYRHLEICSSVVLVRPDARALIEAWVKWTRHGERLGAINPGEWFWDQSTLREAHFDCGVPCNVIPFHIYADDQLRDDSAIWAANVGDRKPEYYARFVAEYERQRAISASYSRT